MKAMIRMKMLFAAAAVLVAAGVASSCAQRSEAFTFVQISDPQIGFEPAALYGATAEEIAADAALAPAQKQTTRWLSQTVGRILEINPDFVVCTGDMTHSMFSGDGQWQPAVLDSLLALLAAPQPGRPEGIPIYFTPGNHDYRTGEWPGSRETYLERYGYTRFCFMHKGSLFIGFDSNLIQEGLAEEEDEQFAWIGEQIGKYGPKADHIFLFHHVPVVSTALDEPESHSSYPEPYRSRYLELFRSGCVSAVFSGHRHRYASLEDGPLKLINCGPCGIPLGELDAHGDPNISGINVVSVTATDFSWSYEAIESK